MKQRIVILGGGFGGIEAAREIRKVSNYEVLLVDRSPVFTFHGHLHEVVSGRMKPEELEIDLQDFCNKLKIKFLQAEIKHIKKGHVLTSKGKRNFDSLIIAMGSKTCFSVKGIKSCDELKETSHAINLKKHLQKYADGDIVVVGGGLTGVELVMEIAEAAMKHEKSTTVHLVEAEDMVMPGFPKSARKYADKILRNACVSLHYGKKILSANPHQLLLEDGIRLKFDLLIWTAGIQPASHMNTYGLESSRGFIKVNKHLQTSAPGCFAVGDIAWFDVDKSHELWTAVTAVKEGQIAGYNAAKYLDLQPMENYKPDKKHLFLISLGKKVGLITYGNLVMKGKLPLLAKKLFFNWYMKTRK